ncbi:MAG: hypothetical protein LKI53_09655 [Bacteroidales bacterium]|jgi:hypothetical protein|nr:hypothetical protein [Bacteroidales bacterium]
MKKTIYIFQLALIMLSGSFMISCNGSDSEKQEISASICYCIPDLHEAIYFLDLKVKYLNASGEQKEATVTGTPWIMELNNVPLPFSYQAELTVTEKKDPNYKSKDEGYQISFPEIYFYYSINGGSWSGRMPDNSSTIEITSLQDYITKVCDTYDTRGTIHSN